MDSRVRLSTFYGTYDKSRFEAVASVFEAQGAKLFSVEPAGDKTRIGFMCHRADFERMKQEAARLQ